MHQRLTYYGYKNDNSGSSRVLGKNIDDEHRYLLKTDLTENYHDTTTATTRLTNKERAKQEEI